MQRVSSRILSVAVLAILLSFGCGDSDGGSGGGTHCDVDVSGYVDGRWSAPPPGPSRADVEIPAIGIAFGFRWLDGARSSHGTRWLGENEDLAMRISIAAAEDDGSLRDVRAVLLIDGLQQTLLVEEDREVRFAVLEAPPGTRDAETVRVAANAVENGAHSLVVALLHAKSGMLIGGTTFTILKEDPSFADERPVHNAMARFEARSEFSPIARSGDMQVFSHGAFSGIGSDGSLPLTLTMQLKDGTCRGRAIPVFVTALVDFDQVPMSGFGAFSRVLVEYDEAATIETVLRDLPLDGEAHTLSLFQVQGDGLYTEAPPEKDTPWSDVFLTIIGFASW